LPRAIWLEPSKDFAKDVLLPRQQEKRLARRLAFAVLEHLLEKREHTLGLGLVDARPANRVR
jgi:hypothetical protein